MKKTHTGIESQKAQGICNPMLEDKLGRVLRAADMAAYLRLDEKTVRLYYPELGGISHQAVREYVQHWKHYLRKKAMFCLLEQGRQQSQKKMLQKKKKPSQEPSTPKKAFLWLSGNFYVPEITFIILASPRGVEPRLQP